MGESWESCRLDKGIRGAPIDADLRRESIPDISGIMAGTIDVAVIIVEIALRDVVDCDCSVGLCCEWVCLLCSRAEGDCEEPVGNRRTFLSSPVTKPSKRLLITHLPIFTEK